MPGNSKVINVHCFAIVVVCIIVITGLSVLFGIAPTNTIEKDFTQCITAEEPVPLVIPQKNYTKCVSCADLRYQLTSVRGADEEKECGEKAKIHGTIAVNDCCVKVSVSNDNTTLEAVFGTFIGVFLLSFVCLNLVVNKEMEDSANILHDASSENTEAQARLPTHPQQIPQLMYGIPPTYATYSQGRS